MDSQRELRPGNVLDGYEILGELGAGSFGRVYKARQRATGYEVAIKTLRVHERDAPADIENNLARLRREIRLCGELAHPHIVRLLGSGEAAGGLVYVVFEYASGETLRAVLDRERKLELREAILLMSQVLDAVSCAHARGVVHRDLKPENVMLVPSDGQRKAIVLDFGLGGFVTGASEQVRVRLTGSGEMMGTPSYAAPEQLRGEPPSPRSDLYSWGLMFLECVTGEMAVAGRTGYEILLHQLGPEPVRMPAWLEEHRLGRLLRAVTAKDPTAREVTAPLLLDALDAMLRERDTDGPTAEGGDERRPLTVVCCRAVVTGADGGAVDPATERQAFEAYETLGRRLGADAGATVANAAAGELQLVFGYPRVHENDARRAARMGLRLLAEGAKLSGARVRSCIGMHSAVGLVQPLDDDGNTVSCRVVGAPAQLAARLAREAQADELLVSLDTRALLREEMECKIVLELEVPERTSRLPAYRIVGERSDALLGTFAPLHESVFVGRAGELAMLRERWAGAQADQASVVLLLGEAGMGKSRLLRELRREVPVDGWIGCRCLPEGQGSPLHPVLEWLRALAEPIDRLLARHGFDVTESLPLLASLLSIPVGGSPPPGRFSPERQRELTLNLITTLIARMARAQPVVVVLEDLHWADPTTLELVRGLIDEAVAARVAPVGAGLRLMVLLTARQEFTPTWPMDDVSVCSLGRLSRNEVADMLRARYAQDALVPGELVARVAERTDGVPLFVEEMVQVLLDAEGRPRADDGRLVPETLRELLAARLDALSASARRTMQIAAAVGREFRYDLVDAAADRDDWVVRQDVAELLDARLVFPRRRAAQEEYVFKHALVRDAAYESMARDGRRSVHQRIANAIRARLPELAEQEPALLALHLEEGGDLVEAVRWWQRAGDRAFRRAAYAEATQHLARARRVLARVPSDRDRYTGEIETLIQLGMSLLATRGHADPEVSALLSHARALSEEHGIDLSLKILVNLVGVYISEGDREAVEAFLPRLEALVVKAQDPVTKLSGLLPMAIHAFWGGEHARAADLLEQGRPLYRTQDFRRYAEEYGWDGGIYTYAYSIWNLWLTGDPGGAEAMFAQLLDLAEASFDPQSVPLTLAFGMACAHGRHDVVAARARAERLISVASEQRLFFWLAIGQCGRGYALTLSGDVEAGFAELRQGLQLNQMIGARTTYGYYLTYLAAAELAAGHLDEGLATVAEAFALSARDLARVHEPELLRLEGLLRHARGEIGPGLDCLRRGIVLARTRGAITWELRAAVSLADVLGAVDEVPALLAELSERVGAIDLPEVAAVRAALAGARHRM